MAVVTTQSGLTGEARKLQTSSGGRVVRKAKSFLQDAVVRRIEKLAKLITGILFDIEDVLRQRLLTVWFLFIALCDLEQASMN